MAKNYTHYQEYFKSFLGGWTFENGDETLTITDVKEEEMYDAATGSKKSGLCLYFKEKELPMVLNVTNSEVIASVVGSDKLADWIGKRIIVGQSKIKAFGKEQYVIRVRNDKPKDKIKELLTDEQYNKIQELINNNIITNKEAMLKHYKVSTVEEMAKEDAEELIKAKTREDF